jgi:glycosyltransferase 2 family protein
MPLTLRILRLLAGLTVLALVGQRLGSRPFLAAVHAVSAPAVLVALAIGAVTTVFSAWRWSVVAGGLGIHLPLRSAVGAYYRSLFLNGVLPGGVLGDLHRAVRHGRDVGSVQLAVKAVVVERAAGQVVLAGVTLGGWACLVASLGRASVAVAVGVAAVVLAAVGVAAVVLAPVVLAAVGLGRPLTPLRRAPVLAASAVVVSGHVATFVVAAGAAGVAVPLARLLPLSLLTLLAMSVPLNVGGWGPREGVAAWTFGAAGLGSAQGLTIAVLYGLLTLVASLPGAVVLLRGKGAGSRDGGRRPGSPALAASAALP